MKLVYISSPYAGDTEHNTEMARRYCRAAVNRGAIPYAPHLLMPQWMNEHDPAQRKLATEMGLEMIDRVDELWVCGDRISEGMQREIEYAEEHGIPVIPQPYLLREREYEDTPDMDQYENSSMERFLDYINANILPVIDYGKLQESYNLDDSYYQPFFILCLREKLLYKAK